MANIALMSRPFRKGFQRGFVSIVGVYGRNPFDEAIDYNRGSVAAAWRDTGSAIREAVGKLESKDGKTASKSRDQRKTK